MKIPKRWTREKLVELILARRMHGRAFLLDHDAYMKARDVILEELEPLSRDQLIETQKDYLYGLK